MLSDSFSESFLNVPPFDPPACEGGEGPFPPPPTAPTKDQCKKGGQEAFGFKKQGECVAFVNRGSKKKQ